MQRAFPEAPLKKKKPKPPQPFVPVDVRRGLPAPSPALPALPRWGRLEQSPPDLPLQNLKTFHRA